MRHQADHDPIRDHERCSVCSQGLAAGMAKMADMEGWPTDAAMLVSELRRLSLEAIEQGWSLHDNRFTSTAQLDAEDHYRGIS
jgi:hypothetical protein